MKFEIDPNELTTDQRAHVAAFITNWPHADEVDHAGEAEYRRFFGGGIDPLTYTSAPSEEQRLSAEQGADLREGDTTGELRDISGPEEARELGKIAGANLTNLVDIPDVTLNAIFGTPDIGKEINQGMAVRLNSAVPLDKEGLPWDSRIHASTKTFIADGSWKLRRGVDPAEVAAVKAQLKELMAVPTFVSIDDYTPTDVVQALGVPLPPAPVVFGVDLATGTDTAVITQIPPAPKSIDQQPVTLTDLIGRMSKAIAENRLTQATVTELCVKHGVSEFHLLSNRPDLLPLIDVDMKAMGV